MKTLLDLLRDECRWPVDHIGGQHLFCAEGKPDGCSYCAEHSARAYRDDVRKLTDRDAASMAAAFGGNVTLTGGHLKGSSPGGGQAAVDTYMSAKMGLWRRERA